MKSRIFLSILAAVATTIAAWGQYPYKVIVPATAEEGMEMQMHNFDTGEVFNTATVANHAAVFTGEIDEPIVAVIACQGGDIVTFILEQGTTAVNEPMHRAVGSMLNDRLNGINDAAKAMTPAQAKNHYLEMAEENMDTALGYYLFIKAAPSMTNKEIKNFVKSNPELSAYKRVKSMVGKSSR